MTRKDASIESGMRLGPWIAWIAIGTTFVMLSPRPDFLFLLQQICMLGLLLRKGVELVVYFLGLRQRRVLSEIKTCSHDLRFSICS